MKHTATYLVVTLFLVPCGVCFSQEKASAPYQVGFNYYQAYDASRHYIINNDTTSRPMLIHFWYPGDEPAEAGNSSFKNYIDLISIRENFNKPASEVNEYSFNFVDAYAGFAKQHLGIDTSITTQQLLDCPVAARYELELAKSPKKFPLIIYAPSNSKSSVQNHIICEYLASHGFMVISVGSAGSESLNRQHDQKSILAQVVDMEYILNYFEDSLKINYTALGLMGFSSGGLATALFQMRNKKVKAVFSMDGGQEYGAYIMLSRSEDFNLDKTDAPYCLLVNNYENFSIYPFYNSVVSNKKYLFRMPYLDHNGFVSYWKFFGLCASNTDVNQICTSYDYISSTALAFFNAYLTPKPKSGSQPDLNIQASEYIKPVTGDNTLVAQVCNTILTDSIDAAMRFINKNQEAFQWKENELIILSRLLKDPNIEASIQLLLWNQKMHPDSWQTLLELASAYKAKGDLAHAKETALKAQQLNPESSEIMALLNEMDEAEK